MNWEEKQNPRFGRSLYVDNGTAQMIIPLDYGIRIGHFSLLGEENVFYEQPKDMKELATEDGWRIRGGHRLWLAPEATDTYLPDNDPISYEIRGETVVLTQPVAANGIQKSLEIAFGEGACVQVNHRIKNCGAESVTRALWAVSVMAPGGTEYIPLGHREGGLSHWHRISWWDHTCLGDERATYEKEMITIKHLPIDKRYKIGLGHPAGPVRYENKGIAFEKQYDLVSDGVYPDGDVSFETFFCRYMAEVESVSPICTLAPGEQAEHRETWKLYKV